LLAHRSSAVVAGRVERQLAVEDQVGEVVDQGCGGAVAHQAAVQDGAGDDVEQAHYCLIHRCLYDPPTPGRSPVTTNKLRPPGHRDRLVHLGAG
jgi:hypothetical protein